MIKRHIAQHLPLKYTLGQSGLTMTHRSGREGLTQVEVV